ncbi:hypothetical protein ACQ86O_27570 (plasmid) [Serratia sp. L9]|uniref:hypothetical protein n=1 Tax=Serratia sp. L9 TaxID=3423946 RepID=UPI003D672DF7
MLEKRVQTEVRDGISHYVMELVSTLPGTFLVKVDLGVFGETAPQLVTFTNGGSERIA